jgi:hypothetical protein
MCLPWIAASACSTTWASTPIARFPPKSELDAIVQRPFRSLTPGCSETVTDDEIVCRVHAHIERAVRSVQSEPGTVAGLWLGRAQGAFVVMIMEQG